MSNPVLREIRRRDQQERATRTALVDQIMEQSRANAASQALGSIEATSEIKPSPELARLANQQNVPIAAFSGQEERLSQAQKRQQIFDTLRRSPILSDYFKNANRAATVQDSLDELAAFERRNNMELSSKALRDMQQRALSIDRATFARGREPLREETFIRNVLDKGASLLSAIPMTVELMAQGTIGIATLDARAGEMLMQTKIPALERMGMQMVGRSSGAMRGAIKVADVAGNFRDYLEPEQMDFFDQVAQGVGQVAGQIAIYLGTGGLGATGSMVLLGSGQQVERMREQDISLLDNPQAIIAGGATTALLEMLRLERIIKAMPSKAREDMSRTMLARLGRVSLQAAEEGGQEFLENTIQNAIAQFTYEPDAQIWEGALQSLSVGGTVGGVVQALFEVALPGRARTMQTEAGANAMRDIRNLLTGSTTVIEHREDVEQFVNKATEDQTVSLEAEGVTELYQSDPQTTRALLQLIGVEEEQIQRALDGDDITIPASKLVTIADPDQFNQLLDLTRVNPEAKTLREIRQEVKEGLGPELAQRLDEIIDADQAMEIDEQIERNIYEQLRAAGQKKRVSRAAAKVWSSFMRTLEADGVDIETLWDKLGLKILGPDEALPDADEDLDLPQLRQALNMSDEDRRAWYDRNVIVTDEDSGGMPTQFRLRLDENDPSSPFIEVNLYNGNLDFTLAGSFMRERDGVPTMEDVRRANQMMARAGLAIKEHIQRYDVPFLSFRGATQAHANFYTKMLPRLNLPGYKAYAVTDTKAIIRRQDRSTEKTVETVFDDPDTQFVIIKEGMEANAQFFLGLQPEGEVETDVNTVPLDPGGRTLEQTRGYISKTTQRRELLGRRDGTGADRTGVSGRNLQELPDPSVRLRQDKRGVTRIVGGELGVGAVFDPSPLLVKLFEKADKTTFLHESAHIFLEIYAALEADNPAIAERMKPVREWLGWEKGKPLTKQMHEKFADLRGFEGYLTTGKSPAPELDSVFESFRQWFLDVYKALRGKDLKIDDRAREFFDRMLVADETVLEAQNQYHARLNQALEDIMTPEQLEKHRKLGEKAGRLARDRIFKKHLEQIARRNQKQYRDKRKKIKKEVREEIENLPLFKAIKALVDSDKPVTLNRQQVLDIVGNDRIVALEPYLEDDGVSPEIFAADMGFDNADAMLQEITQDPNFEDAIEFEVRRRMDMLDDDFLINPEFAEEQAVEATFNDAQVRKLEVERDALAQRAAKDPIPLKAFRERARKIIDGTTLKKLSPRKHALQAQNLHKKAMKAAANGRFEQALRFTHQAMLQHELARYAFKTESEIQRGNRYLSRFKGRRVINPKQIAPEYIEQMKRLIALPGSRNQQSARQVLLSFEQDQAKNNRQIDMPSDVALGKDLPEQDQMTVQQFREYRDGVKSLHKNGREMSAMAAAKFKELVSIASRTVYNSWGGRARKNYTRSQDTRNKLDKFVANMDAAFLRLPYIAEMLQGDKRGIIADILFNDIAVAQNARENREVKLAAALREIFAKYNITADEMNATINDRRVDKNNVTKNVIFSMLLNMGSISNRQRLAEDPSLKGFAENPETILKFLEERLEKRHFDAAQEIWELIGTQRKDLGQVHKRRSGVTPVWVEARALKTKYGTYAGGYYPLKYDPAAPQNSDIAAKTTEDIFKEQASGIASRAQTRSGMLEERAKNVSRPLHLDIDIIMDHFADVSAFIEMSEVIDKAWSLTSNRTFQKAVKETFGDPYIDAIQTILRRTAVGSMGKDQKSWQWLNTILRNFRVNASVAILGLNIVTAGLAPVSYFSTILPRYGWKVVARGWSEFYGGGTVDAAGKAAKMEELSPFMRERYALITREAHETARKKVFEGTWTKAQALGYVPMAAFEKYTVSGPLWWGVYHTSLAEGLSEAQAIADADKAVSTTQGSGRIMDQSTWQGATNELQRVLTFMWGFVSGVYGVVRLDLSSAETGFGKTAVLVKHFVILNAMASTLEVLLRSGIDLEDEDAETEYLMNVLGRMGRNTMILPGISNFMSRYNTVTAFESTVGKARTAWNSAEEAFAEGELFGEAGRKALIDAATAAGYAFGVPGTTQLEKIDKTFEEDDDPTWYEALITGPDEDN